MSIIWLYIRNAVLKNIHFVPNSYGNLFEKDACYKAIDAGDNKQVYTLRNKLQWHFNQNTNLFIHENAFESRVCEMAAILSWGHELKGTCRIYARNV